MASLMILKHTHVSKLNIEENNTRMTQIAVNMKLDCVWFPTSNNTTHRKNFEKTKIEYK
jgi:hypothetical protein